MANVKRAGGTSTPSAHEKRADVYLTLAPRGIESFVIANIKSQLTSDGYSCWISEIGPSPLTQLQYAQQAAATNTLVLDSTVPTTKDSLDEVAAKIEYNKYKKKIKKRKKEGKGTSNEQTQTKPVTFHEFVSNNPDLSRITGSIDVPVIGSHASLGYQTVQEEVQKILTVPGTLEGAVLVAFETDAPPLFVASMSGMGCGPLLAMVTSSCFEIDTKNEPDPTTIDCRVFDYDQTLDEGRSAIQNFFIKIKDTYFEKFESAVQLWQRHRKEVWFVHNSIYGHYKSQDGNDASEQTQQISYRLSCTRSHSKKYAHQREDLVPLLADFVIPMNKVNQIQLDPVSKQRHDNNTTDAEMSNEMSWVVDLKDYDVEIVSLIHYGCLTVAIPLRPYQLWGSRSYRSNTIPCDGSGSFGRLGPKRSLGRFVHLRPSTADILISIANLPPHSIVLDPCAGIGTINIRASLQSHYGLGGEIVPSLFEEHAPYFLDCNGKFHHSQSRGAVDMNGWDATMLPLRDSFVDAVISDIPFGQKCLTHNELHAFMSGFIYECARVLTKNTGKMILLCGDYEIVHSTLASLNERSARSSSLEEKVFRLPCESVFPVNISGILAWVIVVHRGCGKPFPSSSYRVRTKPKHRLSYARK